MHFVMQIIHGIHGLRPSEPVIEFINKHHTHFTGGIFFVNGAASEFVEAAEKKISQVRPFFVFPSRNVHREYPRMSPYH